MGTVIDTKRFWPDGSPLLTDNELIDLEPKNYRYHSYYRPSLYFCGARDNGNNLFLGFELEFDTRRSLATRRSNKMDIIEKSNRLMGNNTDIYYMNDSSLTNGLEIISQPATYEFHVERYDVYKELFDYIKEHGFGSQSFQTCGLHIHFNRSFYKEDEDTFITNLISLVNKFWRDLVLISRRKYDKVVKWANKYEHNPDYIVDRYKKIFYMIDIRL